MTSTLSRCPLCLEPVALCSCDETEREVAMAARALRSLPDVFACADPEGDWIRDQEEAAR